MPVQVDAVGVQAAFRKQFEPFAAAAAHVRSGRPGSAGRCARTLSR
jgi:hypothetical protein